ncbi:succinylglutamate desuccinylase/aspartoacylase family protein [Patescibacteria group bacterium]|nr:succinylglutamate desuccinylase/aspartoacylase family protein [Patescibacteria group bacterium]
MDDTTPENIGDSIWRIQSTVPGPSVCIIGGMHGNEAAGIEVVRMLLKEFEDGRHLASGTLTLALGNTRAIEKNERWIDGKDLNRQFSDAHLIDRIDQSWEEERAITLARLIREADLTLDIHSTNKPSSTFICSRADERHARVYRWFPITHVIEDPEYVFGDGPVTTDEYADRMGKVGMCIESGWVNDAGRIEETKRSVEAVLSDFGLSTNPLPPLPSHTICTYRFYKTIKLDERGFTFADGRGLASFEPLKAGEVLGYHGDDPVTLDQDAFVIFPKLKAHWQLGWPICYIAIPI